MIVDHSNIDKIIDELFLCVREADWNCAHPNDDYDWWNTLSYPREESVKIQEQVKGYIMELWRKQND